MARSRNQKNGHLEEAIALLLQNQASFLAHQVEHSREMAELKRSTDERFLRIEALLLEHSRVLAELTRTLQRLPEAVRERIGFKSPEQARPAE